jgi:hypothetical protein
MIELVLLPYNNRDGRRNAFAGEHEKNTIVFISGIGANQL